MGVIFFSFKRNIAEREKDYPHFTKEFGHIEGDTIVGVQHKSAGITLVERLSKVIITFEKMAYQKKWTLIKSTNRLFPPLQIREIIF